jgi:hypothetical protein
MEPRNLLVPAGLFLDTSRRQELKMKLAAISLLAVLAATPAFAQAPAPASDSATSVTPPSENPNVDDRTAATDTARQDMYKHKLAAAKAQSKADSAIADRDVAQAQADQDRQDKNSAQGR